MANVAGAVSKFGFGVAFPLSCSISATVDDISKEKYDLLAVGRALLSDHEWVLKMKEGRLKDVIPYSKEALLKLY